VPPIGLTQLQDFPTLSWGLRYTINAEGGYVEGPDAPDPASAVGFSYVGNDYFIEVPGFPRNLLAVTDQSSRFTSTLLNGPLPPPLRVALYRPGSGNVELALSHTSLGLWEGGTFDPQGRRAFSIGAFAYGVPTSAAGLPTSSRETYHAAAYGMTARPFGAYPGSVQGSAGLVVDFAARSLNGDFTPVLNDGTGASEGLGRYDLTAVTFAADGTTFSGQFIVPGLGLGGLFEGRFTGPQGQELMVRWQAPFVNPYNGERDTMFGVWVGRRG
jgi:hypothetical protein